MLFVLLVIICCHLANNLGIIHNFIAIVWLPCFKRLSFIMTKAFKILSPLTGADGIVRSPAGCLLSIEALPRYSRNNDPRSGNFHPK